MLSGNVLFLSAVFHLVIHILFVTTRENAEKRNLYFQLSIPAQNKTKKKNPTLNKAPTTSKEASEQTKKQTNKQASKPTCQPTD